MEFFFPLCCFFWFSGRSYTNSWLRDGHSWCVSGEGGLAVQNLGLSLELDLWSSAGFLLTRALPWWSPASFDPVVSSHGRGGPSCSGSGQHAPGSFLPLPVREGHSLSCPAVVGGDRWFRMSSATGGLLKTACALHASAPAIPDAGCFCGFLEASCLFLFFCTFLSLFTVYLCNGL
jgi:hypothetical protein